MKANELSCKDLMIGDWVTGKKWRENPFQLTRLNDNGKYYYGITSDGTQVGPFLLEEIEPILLTLEFLEKNGFENDFYEEESVADCHKIRLQGYSLKNNIDGIDEYLITWCNGSLNVTTDFHGCVQKEIAYVHQLQHALRLCGITHKIIL